MASRTFLDGRRYRTDDCAKECKDLQNDGIAGWTMYQHLPVKCRDPQGSSIDFQYDHPNLHSRVGVGLAESCVVDRYSQLRNDPNQLTRDRCHIQLYSRIFQGCPNLRMGEPNTDVEGPLVQGTNNGNLEGVTMPCKRSIMEAPMGNFVELLPCMSGIQDPKHTVESWTRGGDDTRSWVRRQELLKACAPEHLRQQRF